MQSQKEEKEKNNEKWELEPREWEEIKNPPYLFEEQKFAVCIDTLGQDRELTDDEKRTILNYVSKLQ